MLLQTSFWIIGWIAFITFINWYLNAFVTFSIAGTFPSPPAVALNMGENIFDRKCKNDTSQKGGRNIQTRIVYHESNLMKSWQRIAAIVQTKTTTNTVLVNIIRLFLITSSSPPSSFFVVCFTGSAKTYSGISIIRVCPGWLHMNFREWTIAPSCNKHTLSKHPAAKHSQRIQSVWFELPWND